MNGYAPPPAWYADAICSQVDPELWFPEGGQSPRGAKEICATCPVLDLCRDYALADPTLDGVWGGTTLRERQAIRSAEGGRRVSCARCGTSFKAVNSQRKYCGPACQEAAHHEQKVASHRRTRAAA